MKTKQAFLLLAAIAAFFLITPTGCATKLESGGAYAQTNEVTGAVAPDKAFFAVDAAFDLATFAVDAAFKFERDNRVLLWRLSPEIKRGLDRIRPRAAAAVTSYAVAREAYTANPTPAGLTQLQTILGQMRQLAEASSAVLPKE